MNSFSRSRWLQLLTIFAVLITVACSPTEETPTAGPTPTPTPTQPAPEVEPPPTSTPTPTPLPPQQPPTATPTMTPSRCAGLSGTLETQVLAGPAEAVGLDPYSIGDIPWAVTSDRPPFPVTGGGNLNYNNVLTENWGTYAVDMNLDLTVSGECSGEPGSESLQLSIEMSGSQMVEVTADGFHGEYPWSGSHTFSLDLPLMEGASHAGEGYSFVLHLNG